MVSELRIGHYLQHLSSERQRTMCLVSAFAVLDGEACGFEASEAGGVEWRLKIQVPECQPYGMKLRIVALFFPLEDKLRTQYLRDSNLSELPRSLAGYVQE
jgi:hypothetical protein